MPRVKHDDPEMVYACPACDSAGEVFHRTGNGNAYVGDPDAEYVCHQCQATFDEPGEREKRSWTPHGGGREATHGKGLILERMSVEEFDAIVHGDGTA